MPGLGRFWRLLRVLISIEANPHQRVCDLARECEVSERTILRDIESLKLAGVPIYFERGSNPGYRLTENFFLPPVRLTTMEAISLVAIGESMHNQAGLPYGRAIESAVDKIVADMPDALKTFAHAARKSIVLDNSPLVDYGKHYENFNAIERARRERKSIKLVYRTFSHKTVGERLVDPYALLYRQNAWYLIGFCHMRQKERMFRVDRMDSISISEASFSLPNNFLVDNFLTGAWRLVRGKPQTVRIRFTGDAALRVSEGKWHPSQQLEWVEGGHLIMSVKIAGLQEFASWVLGFGAEAEVIEPPELRQIIAENATQMTALYGSKPARRFSQECMPPVIVRAEDR